MRTIIYYGLALAVTVPLFIYGFHLFDVVPWRNADMIGCLLMGSVIIAWILVLEIGNMLRDERENRIQ